MILFYIESWSYASCNVNNLFYEVSNEDLISVQRFCHLVCLKFLGPPFELYPESQLWELKRYIYELNDGPCSWYKIFSHELTNLKGIVSSYDDALYFFFFLAWCNRWLNGYSGNVSRWFYIPWKWYISVECDLKIKRNIQNWNMKMKHSNFQDWVFNKKKKWDYYKPKSLCFIYIPKRPKERKVLEKKWWVESEEDKSKRTGRSNDVGTTQTRPDVSFDLCWMSNTGINKSKVIVQGQ